jgi:hypothetical protein
MAATIGWAFREGVSEEAARKLRAAKADGCRLMAEGRYLMAER